MDAATMRSSLAGGLAAAFARNLPAIFFSAATRDRMHRVAAALPGAATDFFGFECRLGGAPPDSDFLVCIDRGATAACLGDAVAARPPSPDPFWRSLADFCRAWSSGDRPWGEAIHNLWLEFDLAGLEGPTSVPVPSVFVGSEHLASGADPMLADAVCEALDQLAGVEPSRARRLALRHALAALPPGGSLFQIGLMLSRSDERIRICAKGMDAAAQAAFLARLGDVGRAGMLARVEAEIAAPCTETRIGFDAGPDGLGRRLGIECYCSGDDAYRRWPRFGGLLLDHGLALPHEIAAITGWTSLIHRRLLDEAGALWLDMHQPLSGGMTDAGVHRWLHHVKLTVETDRPTAAKAYLAAEPLWLPPGHLAAILRGASPMERPGLADGSR